MEDYWFGVCAGWFVGVGTFLILSKGVKKAHKEHVNLLEERVRQLESQLMKAITER